MSHRQAPMGIRKEVMDIETSVINFRQKMNLPVSYSAKMIEQDRLDLHMTLLFEEFAELTNGINQRDMVEIADGIVDLCYIAVGLAVELGIPFNRVFNEIHQTNLMKSPEFQAGGKILKPEGWEPPKVEQILINRGYIPADKPERPDRPESQSKVD